MLKRETYEALKWQEGMETEYYVRLLTKGGESRKARKKIDQVLARLQYLGAKIRVSRCLSGRVVTPTPGPFPGALFDFPGARQAFPPFLL